MTHDRVGKVYPSEKSIFRDPATGRTMWQLTAASADHHGVYMTKMVFTADS